MPAPKGNKFGKNNHNAGAKPLYDDPIALADKITLYFETDANKRTIVIGKGNNAKLLEIPIYTITGLCYYLGFESRQSFYDYAKNEAFSYIIKKARLRIEQHYEELLQLESSSGAIFALKNMDWSDRVISDQNHSGEIVITRKIIGNEKH